MATEVYEKTLTLSKLYKAGRIRQSEDIGPQGKANLFVNSGSVNVYGSNSATQPTALSQMVLNAENTGVSGIIEFNLVPKWIAITQNTGTTTELVSYGITTGDMGAIS